MIVGILSKSNNVTNTSLLTKNVSLYTKPIYRQHFVFVRRLV